MTLRYAKPNDAPAERCCQTAAAASTRVEQADEDDDAEWAVVSWVFCPGNCKIFAPSAGRHPFQDPTDARDPR
jgi:hypothetical protein